MVPGPCQTFGPGELQQGPGTIHCWQSFVSTTMNGSGSLLKLTRAKRLSRLISSCFSDMLERPRSGKKVADQTNRGDFTFSLCPKLFVDFSLSVSINAIDCLCSIAN